MGVDLWAKGANAVVIAMATVLILSMLAGTISADQTWTVEMVDPSGSAGTQVSLALDPSGNPHIAYLDTSTHQLLWAHRSGTDWAIVSIGSLGECVSISLDSTGAPHFAYCDLNHHVNLRFCNPSYKNWRTSAVDSTGNFAQVSLVHDSGGNERLSYVDTANGDLRYAYYSGGAFIPTTVDSGGEVGEFSSLALGINNTVFISYYDRTNGDLKMATSVNNLNWNISVVDATGDVGRYTSLKVDAAGYPCISYYDVTNGNLKYARLGSGGWTFMSVEYDGDEGTWTSLALNDQGQPFISYMNNDDQQLKYAWRSGDVLLTDVVDASTGCGYHSSMTVSANRLRIAYGDLEHGFTKFATTDLNEVGWSPVFTNAPADGQETVPYEHTPSFNETVSITAHSTNAPFLVWDGTAYAGVPNTEQAGIYWISITATSVSGGLSAHQNSTFLIMGSWAPSFTSGPATQGRELSLYEYQPECNETASWSVSSSASFLVWDGTRMSGTPGPDGAGTYWVHIGATSSGGKLTAWQNYTLVVGDTWAPKFTNVPADGLPGTLYSYVPSFNETVTIAAHSTNAPFLTWTGTGYVGTPGLAQAGSYCINITAKSTVGLLSAHQNRTFTIGEGWAPSFTSSPGDGREAIQYSYVPTFNETVSITAHSTNAPFLTWTGTGYVGTPSIGMAGSYWTNITAASVGGMRSTYQNGTFTIAASWAPNFTNAPGDGREASTYSYIPSFNESVTITAHSTNAPFLTWTGTGYVGTPGLTQAGSYWISITAFSVNGGLSIERSSSFTIRDSWAPAFTSVPGTQGRELSPYGYQPSCNETVVYVVSENAVFLSWDGTRLSGTPGTNDAGTYSIHIGAISITGTLTAWQNYTLVVGDTWAPKFTNAPENGGVDVPYEHVPTFNESVDIITHGTNAQFLSWDGTGYRGTPDVKDVGSYWINITARSVNGTLSSYQNRTFQVVQGWAPTFTNAPGDGMELHFYEHTPSFNETVSITAHSTSAPFLTWDGGVYWGMPQVGHAGTYWINLSALSSLGQLSSWQNSTFTIAPVGLPTFVSPAPIGPFFAPLVLVYVIELNEPCTLSMLTDASFLSLQGNEVRGQMAPGMYDVRLQAISVRSGLTCWQNFTMQVLTDNEAPKLMITGLADGAYTNSTTLELDLSSMDGDGSGGVTFWSKINQAPWFFHGLVSRITLELPQGTSRIHIKGADRVGNEGHANLTVHIDTVGPVVLSHSHSGTKVAPEGALSVAFSKAMDRGSVMVRVNGAPLNLTWQDNIALFSPSEGWDEDTEYEVSVNGRDIYGNQLLEVSWTFRTGFAMVLASGTITDAFGRPVANATLSVNGTVMAVTDQNGYFYFELRPGQYRIIVSGEGFEDRSIEINLGRTEPVEMGMVLDLTRELPWTIWLPLPFFFLEAAIIVIYRRRHP